MLGDPYKQDTTLGPMANLRFANNVRKHVEDAISKGAKPLIDTKLFVNDKVKKRLCCHFPICLTIIQNHIG